MKSINKKAEVTKIFFEVNKMFKRSMHRSFEDIGITLPQSLVISTLIKSGEMKISELSRKINLSNSTISGIIDRLEKKQLVVRTRSEVDRRIVYVKVSPKFEEIHKGFIKKAEESFAELLSAGTSEDIDKIIDGLTTLKKILNERN